MKEKELVEAVGKALYWAYTKKTAEAPGKWGALKDDERDLWRSMGRRAYRKVQELAPQVEEPASK